MIRIGFISDGSTEILSCGEMADGAMVSFVEPAENPADDRLITVIHDGGAYANLEAEIYAIGRPGFEENDNEYIFAISQLNPHNRLAGIEPGGRYEHPGIRVSELTGRLVLQHVVDVPPAKR